MSTFTAEFNVTGTRRKELVTRISEAMDCPAKYQGAPSFAYMVDYITIDRNGTVSFDDRADSEEIEHLFDYLDEHGFGAERKETGAAEEDSTELTIRVPKDNEALRHSRKYLRRQRNGHSVGKGQSKSNSGAFR